MTRPDFTALAGKERGKPIGGDGLPRADLIRVQPPTREQVAHTRHLCAEHATSSEDLQLLLSTLGIAAVEGT